MVSEDDEDDKILVYCNNVEVEPVVKGSIKIAGNCGHTVWMSPATYQFYESIKDKADVQCNKCVSMETLKELWKAEKFVTTPAGREELASYVGEEATEQVFEDLKVSQITEEEYDKYTGGGR